MTDTPEAGIKNETNEPEGLEKKVSEQAEDSDDSDIGPMPSVEVKDENRDAKRRRVLPHEKLYLEQLPTCPVYERSYMHREVLSSIQVASHDFLVTSSLDGHLKFWKKTKTGIEFVKHFKAHLGAVVGLSLSADGQNLASISQDRTLKVFDIINFDMINIIRLDYIPGTVAFIYPPGNAQALIACSHQDEPFISVYDGKGGISPVFQLKDLHTTPVTCMAYNSTYGVVVTGDKGGMVECWSPQPPHQLPTALNFKYKSETDLYEFKKTKSHPASMTFSPDGQLMAFTSFTSDRMVRVFRVSTCKLVRKYDEGLEVYNEIQQAGSDMYKLDAMEFGRRLAVEREWVATSQAASANAVFDDSGNFLIYATMLGIKIINLVSNKVVALLGKSEPHRFLNLGLYQGAPEKKRGVTLAMMSANNPLLQESEHIDPSLFCTSYKRNRFYIFTQRDPNSGEDQKADRDIFNEKPTREEVTIAAQGSKKGNGLGHSAVIHTTEGDIHFQLFPDEAPKAVENFCTHATNGYYDNVIFHRVIKNFMLQTGDPLGDGTGGESIWKKEFEDEFSPHLKHDRPYTLSMANAGPTTNGSQFFITTVPTPWLDRKHTIFGRATSGMDVIHRIENAATDNIDKPVDDINILSIDIK
ncbi:Peptidyl-prolyl cis-trans isomerase cyp15 [Entomophthora muscae]|uniref:Peptidyl-prolyl cis-trans isomerase cyp15 n=1 Tax=Entomophthora muscae TaxID=34485 RepID=A0ACC2TI54_9FUNG|nr:Peptidyl-prolyl cis-trans isomerase cyp15 [Entomophthora muscae]